ncbi:MAG: cell division protein ZapD [Methylotetracoccus sp.]
MSDKILYEFPLNERIRLFIRLEKLFHEIEHFGKGASPLDSRAAVSSLVDVLTIAGRYDLKSELLKEIDRYNQYLGRFVGNDRVDRHKIEQVLGELREISELLYRSPGKLGQSLLETDLFKAIAQRNSMPGGTCSFDLPAFYFWLEQDAYRRSEDLTRWLEPFDSVRSSIRLLLAFLRGSATPTAELAQAGFFQRNLDHSLPLQLLRVLVSRHYPCFAEISGGRHRVTVRFMRQVGDGRPAAFQEDVEFRLSCCIL